jgi:membrane protein DedA with SNARE-associated domain
VAHHVYILLSHFFARYGYWAIFLTVFLENTGAPAPGDTVVLFAGFVAHRGSLSLVWTIFAATSAAISGQCLGFVIGRVGGEAFIQKYRRGIGVSQSRYDRAQKIFVRNAFWAVFIARYVVVLREVAGLLCGVFRFPLPSFLISNASGAVVWAVSMSCLGYFLSQSWRKLLHFVSRMDIVILILFCLAAVIVLMRQRKAASGKQ